MRPRTYKLAAPVQARWPRGGLVSLAPLPRDQVELAEAGAAALHQAHGCKPEGLHFELSRRAHILAAAIAAVPDELLLALGAAELAELFATWSAHQEEVGEVQDLEQLRERLRKDVMRDLVVMRDGQAAYCAQGPSEYYGRALGDLTDAQLDYFLLLRAAYKEAWVDGEHRKVSKQWLMSDG